jgi:UDP-N-acetylglucosamine 4,6-dehydratase/5-epimerase
MINNKKILITGGTGFFGQNFTDYLLKNFKPKHIIIFSRDEAKQYYMQQKFRDKRVKFFIGDVRDVNRLIHAFRDIDIVVHAAALKHVPATEYNPSECIKTNVSGSQNIIDAALSGDSSVKKVIAISTDKAVNPINIYGASKLAADKLFISSNNFKGKKDIKFSVVRYGNVFESRGSVIPFFMELEKEGKKSFPITDVNMTRFFISIEDGIKQVVNSIFNSQGGEIFIPKMPSLKITDLAKAINPNMKIKITGIRPGEKLHETLISLDNPDKIIEFKNYYTILPTINLFLKNQKSYFKNYLNEKGKLLNHSVEYNSFNNPNYYTIKEVKKFLQKTNV